MALIDRLRERGERVTRSRQVVVRVLEASPKEQFSAEEVARLARQIDPTFHRSTAYRVLSLLAAYGLVERDFVGMGCDKRALYKLKEVA